ncbi:MAG TPA: ChbG/HpnK family deacetylase [Syntrophorhabdaceae bacterium]|jgi:hopanoid biosynthesis associated protein HpnK
MTMERGARSRKKYVVIGADDFGSSPSVNNAVAAAKDHGCLTAASVMAGGAAFHGAVDVAARHPGLSVGLHVVLSQGRPVLSPVRIPDLVDKEGRFDPSPFRAGVMYWSRKERIGEQIEAEVRAQFDKVEDAGIHPSHVDCHHHLHIHPLLFTIISREAARRRIAWIRIPREPWPFLLRLHGPTLDAKAFLLRLVFELLNRRNMKAAYGLGLHVANTVYGTSGTGRIDERYLLAVLPYIKNGIHEIYLHPDSGTAAGQREKEAVISKRVGDSITALGIQPVGFKDLEFPAPHTGVAADSFAYGH